MNINAKIAIMNLNTLSLEKMNRIVLHAKVIKWDGFCLFSVLSAKGAAVKPLSPLHHHAADVLQRVVRAVATDGTNRFRKKSRRQNSLCKKGLTICKMS